MALAEAPAHAPTASMKDVDEPRSRPRICPRAPPGRSAPSVARDARGGPRPRSPGVRSLDAQAIRAPPPLEQALGFAGRVRGELEHQGESRGREGAVERQARGRQVRTASLAAATLFFSGGKISASDCSDVTVRRDPGRRDPALTPPPPLRSQLRQRLLAQLPRQPVLLPLLRARRDARPGARAGLLPRRHLPRRSLPLGRGPPRARRARGPRARAIPSRGTPRGEDVTRHPQPHPPR